MRQRFVVFYATKLGLYPFIDEQTGMCVNGGIPQLGNLQEHLKKARKDILSTVNASLTGLAVIDWGEWTVQWERNWKPKNIYWDLSVDLVIQNHPHLSSATTTLVAKEDFERTGKEFFLKTILLARRLRPHFLWGFYLYPECYNNGSTNLDFEGSCSEEDKRRNDQLSWLWKESTAFFPNMYLHSRLSSTHLAALFVRNRVQEAHRLSRFHGIHFPVPIYFYTRPVFTDVPTKYLSQYDLENTLGECVALGVSGIVFWGNVNLTRSKQDCTNLANYLTTTLNPYIINLTLAAKMCSQVLCQGLGICVRKDWNSSDYLHLNPENFAIQAGNNGQYTVDGKPTIEDLTYFSEKFNCSCYTHSDCIHQENIGNTNLDSLNVCITNNICIGNKVTEKSTYYRFREKENPVVAQLPCVSGANLSGCVEANCSQTPVLTNAQEDCQGTNGKNMSRLQNKKIEPINASRNLVLVPFLIHIFFVLMSLNFLYSSI
ncbi:hyaluronidase PH-20-like [Tenrec ecaudatus]|uniref:hyaluronidase PH-20-like n=1 Tax=Tenrec ecaudatus TaxID=94439 RepID=UPI003F5A100F